MRSGHKLFNCLNLDNYLAVKFYNPGIFCHIFSGHKFMPKVYQRKISLTVILLSLIFVTSCDSNNSGHYTSDKPVSGIVRICDEDNGGLVLPEGFCARIVADSLGFIRHLAVNDNGDLYVALRNHRLNLGGIVALRDSDKDGRMDYLQKFSDIPGMGIKIKNGFLYFASDTDIYRYTLGQKLIPELPPQVLVHDLPAQGPHAGKPFALDDDNQLYVNIGAISNACQQEEVKPGSPGLEPCPELQNQAGIWRFSLDKLNQSLLNGYHYASGIRNAYAIDWYPAYKGLYVVQHGREHLHDMWPDIYNLKDDAMLPAEEFIRVDNTGEYGWPYCYFDPVQHKRVIAPEYGGDGKMTGRCEKFPRPLVAFPAHFGPNDLKFYNGKQFPAHYQQGAFIAFHGSYNRDPFKQVGYQVVFVPFNDGVPAGDWEVFADGFAGVDEVKVPEDANYRPTGLAIGPDGSLYIADSVQGRIWRVVYTVASASDESRSTR
jgi:glucose/arabinose dehydrogenase